MRLPSLLASFLKKVQTTSKGIDVFISDLKIPCTRTFPISFLCSRFCIFYAERCGPSKQALILFDSILLCAASPRIGSAVIARTVANAAIALRTSCCHLAKEISNGN